MMKNFLSEEQSSMIDYLIEGCSITDISKLINKSRSTIYKWLELDQVKAEMQTRQSEMKSQARTKIASKVDSCINNIYEIAMTSKDPRTKLSANKYLTDQFLGSPSASQEALPKENNTITIDIVDDIDIMLKQLDEMEQSV